MSQLGGKVAALLWVSEQFGDLLTFKADGERVVAVIQASDPLDIYSIGENLTRHVGQPWSVTHHETTTAWTCADLVIHVQPDPDHRHWLSSAIAHLIGWEVSDKPTDECLPLLEHEDCELMIAFPPLTEPIPTWVHFVSRTVQDKTFVDVNLLKATSWNDIAMFAAFALGKEWVVCSDCDFVRKAWVTCNGDARCEPCHRQHEQWCTDGCGR